MSVAVAVPAPSASTSPRLAANSAQLFDPWSCRRVPSQLALMVDRLPFQILPQPDDLTCGPTCLHAVYQYFGDSLPLNQVIAETTALEQGGTLAVLLACHALRRGYRATIYTFNLEMFDPTWLAKPVRSRSAREQLIQRLHLQAKAKPSAKLQTASAAYVEFLQLGGSLRMEDLTSRLLRRLLRRQLPILTGLSATYLYRSERELPHNNQPDDIHGLPCGHFVVIYGCPHPGQLVQIADPYLPNPLGEAHYYEVRLHRLICSIMLGVLTYDANLLVLEPPAQDRRPAPLSSVDTRLENEPP